nr:methyltransferase domain-containing protein [Beutenbergia cavernae]
MTARVQGAEAAGPSGERARYTHGHHESVLRSHTWRTAANSAAYLLPELAEGMDVLDVGCGPGTITADLGKYVAPGRVVGIDTAEDVLVRAAEFAAARDVDNVLFETGDVYALGYSGGSFDVVHAHQVLQHLGDPVAALRQMRRVLRPGGVLAVRDADYGAMRWYPEVPALDDWQRLYRAVARRNGGEPDAGRRVLAWVREAGFDDVTPSSSTWCFAEPDLREWWSGLWADRLTKSAFAAHAKKTGLADDAELARLAAGFREWGEDPDGWFVVVHGEVLARR